jgi:hypothetical protein
MHIDLTNNYWLAGNRPGVVFGSAAGSWVAPTDATYQAWLAAGRLPSRVLTDGELADVLFKAGLPVVTVAAVGLTSLGNVPAEDVLALKLAVGLAVTSAGAPAISGTYAADAQSQSRLQGLLLGFSLRGTFPGGGASFPYPDVAGATHVMTQPQMQAVGAAIEDYVAALTAAAATPEPAWPPATAAIA